jgi:hypothetical protein
VKVELHQTPGCTLLRDRFYIFDGISGAQITDQPIRGFADITHARMWLSDTASGLRPERFTIAQGREATPA